MPLRLRGLSDSSWFPRMHAQVVVVRKEVRNLQLVQGRVGFPSEIAFVVDEAELATPLLYAWDEGQPTDLMIFAAGL